MATRILPSVPNTISNMMTTQDTLAKNIAALARHRGMNLKVLAQRAGIGRTTLTRVMNGGNVSIEILTSIASVLRVPISRLFVPPDSISDDSPPYGAHIANESAPLLPDYVRIPLLDVDASAGAGAIPLTQPEVLGHLDVLTTWAERELGSANVDNLRIISAKGDSMSPTLNDGDIVFVDTARSRFDGEGIYVFMWQDHLLIKRLRIAGNTLAIHSDNSAAYPPEFIQAEEVEQLHIRARVLAWWTLRRY